MRSSTIIILSLVASALLGSSDTSACGWGGETDNDDEIIMLDIGADGKPIIDEISIEMSPAQQTELGNKLRDKEDYQGSLLWYSKAADSGYAEAQNNLAGLYEFGLGVPQDMAKAALWYQRAATSGEPHAQHSLGMMYAAGRGVARNIDQATVWLGKSADQKHLKAFADMAHIQDNGPEQLKWLLLAVHYGDRAAQTALDAARSSSSEADMNIADTLFKQWLSARE